MAQYVPNPDAQRASFEEDPPRDPGLSSKANRDGTDKFEEIVIFLVFIVSFLAIFALWIVGIIVGGRQGHLYALSAKISIIPAAITFCMLAAIAEVKSEVDE